MFAEKSRISPAGLPAAAASFVMFPPWRLGHAKPPESHRRRDEGGAEFGQFAGGPERVAGEAADPAADIGREEERDEEGDARRRSAPAGRPAR